MLFQYQDFLFFLNTSVTFFLKNRGLELRNLYFFNSSSLGAFPLIDSKFFISPYSKLKSVLFSQVVCNYKVILKSIIKNSYNLPIFKVVKKINKEIINWNNKRYCSVDCLNLELDLYLYKLLWKFVRRSHSRRGKIWVYNKYWKNCSRCVEVCFL